MSLFYKLDLFKLPIFLRIDQQDKNSTWLGQLISGFIIIYLAYSFFTSDVFIRTHPIIVDQPKTELNHPLISFDSSNFALSLAVTDTTSKAIIDPTIFSINLYYNKIPKF